MRARDVYGTASSCCRGAEWLRGDPAAAGFPQPRHVEVWLVSLDRPPSPAAPLSECLTGAERARCARFATPELRRRFANCRALLRTLLAHRLGIPPAEVPLELGIHGKPFVRSDGPGRRLRFNVSHSAGLAAIAVAADVAVGVDIESMRADIEYDEVARSFFTAPEMAALDAVSGSDRIDVFYRIWTRKEAALKAFGVGIGGADPLQIPLVRVIRERPERGALGASVLGLLDLPAVQGFAGAVAVPAPDWSASWKVWG